jgi:hypothetical protein
MAASTQYPADPSLNARLDSVRDTIRRRQSWQTAGKPAAPPLDPAEADLCARLTTVLSRPPDRGHRHVHDTLAQEGRDHELADRLARALRGPVQDIPDIPPAPGSGSFDMTDDAVAGARVKTITWLQRPARRSWRTAAKLATAWLVTLAIIIVTVATMMAAVLGWERSVEIAQLAADATNAAIGMARRIVAAFTKA